MDHSTRQSVAAADYGYRAEQHLVALNKVLEDKHCRFPKDEFWFPSEVVELVAYVRSAKGFVCCTALLLANALQNNDKHGWFEFRWAKLAEDYNALPVRVRNPIMAGMRHLYEADRYFCCDTDGPGYDPLALPDRMISYRIGQDGW